MSDDSEQNRSEQPSQFKLTRARRDGSVARGPDVGFMASVGATSAFAWFAGQSLVQGLSEATSISLGAMSARLIGIDGFVALMMTAALPMIRPLLAFMGVLFAAVLVLEFIQTGPVFSMKPLTPDFSRLDPAKGLKRLFSARILVETVKATLKLFFYAAIAGLFVWQAMTMLPAAIGDARALIVAMADLSLKLLASAAVMAVFFAVLDQIVVRGEYAKKMRMSRREVRREHRDHEGDPRLKQRRKELHGQFAQVSQSLRGIRSADVVVTNPVHFAVALRYDPAAMAAPLVVARGSHGLAARLRRLAFAYRVAVVVDPVLARALYRQSHLSRPIPESCFAPVADVYLALRRARRSEQASSNA